VYGDGRRLRCDNRDLWQSDVDATARKDYIQTTLKANQALGTEVRHAAWIGAWIGAAASDWSGQALAREGVCHCVHLVAYQPGPGGTAGIASRRTVTATTIRMKNGD
jgi:hypothetical protein